ncbi:MAG: acetyl-CoA carboxylase biotin carboxyl carrier protein [Candidatus Latescibacteria bacterium]|nr:acetyl-CoA carboxylase biotin carboxyl carrier protein [Candidatus Latescibacterota bacterium]
MDKATFKELLDLYKSGEAEELEIQHSFWHGTRIRISRRATVVAAPEREVARAVSPPLAAATPATAAPAAAPAADGLHVIPAPMVGTFYRSPSPESDPFVREGERIRPGQTVCLIEAMKIMNEIEADLAGEVVEILVGNGEPVEYNQPLMKIRPA